MKILHITDSHGTVKSPEGRKDVYYITFLKKLYELGFVVKKLGINVVVHTGDLFHTARVSNKFAGQVSELIKAMGVDFYVVPGNHDIEGYTIDTIDQTMLGLMAKTGVVKLLTREAPVQFLAEQDGETFTIGLSGQEYYGHIDEGNGSDFEMQQDLCDLNILAIHGYVVDSPQHPDIRCTMVNDIATDADIILSGHYHRQFEWHGADIDVYNPGSMMRVEQTEYNKTHMPQYGILDISLDNNGDVQYDYSFHTFRIAEPSTTVFDYSSKYKQKHASITLDGFKTSLANTMSQMAPSTNIPQIIQNLGTTVDATTGDLVFKSEVVSRAEQFYNDTLQNLPDMFDVKQGYIPANRTKKIVEVNLHNFQSHEDSVIQFDEGLNIIVGESNNGKTSVLRAILWAIDNQPLGNDFIMAGKDECRVTVKYDDGTWIERRRTIKDSGYYKIRYINDNGNFQTATYRGFANAVPVEVDNVHQMPKVNITKDIETHLNVLSQLDAPFLISESPQNKAAAIGRITGTHVIDAAVKEISRQTRNLSVTINNDKSSLSNEQYALSQLEDYQIVHQASVAYEKVYEAMIALHQRIESLDNAMNEIRRLSNSVLREEENCRQLKGVIKLRPVIDQALESYDKIQKVSGIVSQIQITRQEIAVQENTIERSKPYKQLSPIVFTTLSLCDKVATLDRTCSRIDYLEDAIQDSQTSLSFNRNASHLLANMSNGLTVMFEQFHDIELAHEKVQAKQLLTQGAEVEANGYRKQLTAVKRQITMKTNERTNYILKSGRCPCCGQLVSEKSIAEHIGTFMEDVSNE